MKSINDFTFQYDEFIDAQNSHVIIGGLPKNYSNEFIPGINFSYSCYSNSEKFFLDFNRSAIDKKDITYKDGIITHKSKLWEHDVFYKDKEGNLKWDILFADKPNTNKFRWKVSKSKGISLNFQPLLTEEEKLSGFSRPEILENSIAIYCDKRGHYKSKKNGTIANYKAGKLCHILRPFFIDSNVSFVWCEMLIDHDEIEITIPQHFIDNASYPARLDPTFGYNPASTPGTQQTIGNAFVNIHSNHQYTASTGDTITQYSMYCRYVGSGGGSVAAYDITGSTVGNRLAPVEALQGVTSTAAWRNTNTVSHSLTNGTTYIVGCQEDSGDFRRYGDVLSGGG